MKSKAITEDGLTRLLCMSANLVGEILSIYRQSNKVSPELTKQLEMAMDFHKREGEAGLTPKSERVVSITGSIQVSPPRKKKSERRNQAVREKTEKKNADDLVNKKKIRAQTKKRKRAA